MARIIIPLLIAGVVGLLSGGGICLWLGIKNYHKWSGSYHGGGLADVLLTVGTTMLIVGGIFGFNLGLASFISIFITHPNH